ncbi:DNA-3-methyladenine glycosylase 2 family protein [Stieleria sp. ICT_E10.1]|uniref:DNA-3-methyladenine glycosylase family protein n=1 Tax=Stieleria sedimenti TaxID=2976331 RepID=UPI00217FCEDD|nr:DNA-3-methyladenine glycosylase 2 family protein [Stieleria sedimenti]MCS7471687.1 DNA-3-methyladenine glycosylase 2 family protein [Stieleria sedimenti]
MSRPPQRKPSRLTPKTLAEGAVRLAEADPVLRKIHRKFGPPPLLRRPATYATFVHIILEQQVSVESAKATFDRVVGTCQSELSPRAIRDLGDQRLRELGFSRQKARYALALADACLAGDFDVDALTRLDDEAVRSQIVAQLGLGNWSADVFLMMALQRPDILPVGDLALVKGIQEIDQTEYESRQQIADRAESWRPLRSIATRMVWQWYVHQRGRDIF